MKLVAKNERVVKGGQLQKKFDNEAPRRHAELRSVLQRLARNNAVVVMVTNWGQSPLLWNFGCRADFRGIPWKNFTFVYALDADIQDVLQERGVASWRPNKVNIRNVSKKFGDSQYAKTVFWQIAMVHDILSMGYDVLAQDVDLVWRKDPLKFFAEADPDTDMFWMNDPASLQQPLYINGGFVYVRNNARTRAFWTEAYNHGHSHNSQQSILRPLFVHHYFNNGLRLHVLDNRFANGPLLGIKKHEVPSDWIVAHASWTHNMTDKVAKFRTLGEWDEHCDHGIGKEAWW
ncbi:hypothetical protein CYMTET_38128 [Cymbomonas tetramitiformis]|uniref:Nucleotide-diphospho-sugar transferase domain-containing protein n=1 Tax=Cymbomonas tetramitiformis TaxID=36881 RepID=A0AAE0F6W3_9CHLO|nr:hypothetical protein CYMTET_38128 [Cymbomonas tetramitiformis]|eukprot:gene11909-14065_t